MTKQRRNKKMRSIKQRLDAIENDIKNINREIQVSKIMYYRKVDLIEEDFEDEDLVEEEEELLEFERNSQKSKQVSKSFKVMAIILPCIMLGYIAYIYWGYKSMDATTKLNSQCWDTGFLILSYLIVPIVMTWGTVNLSKEKGKSSIGLILAYSFLTIIAIVFYVLLDYKPIETGLRALFIPVVMALITIFSKK